MDGRMERQTEAGTGWMALGLPRVLMQYFKGSVPTNYFKDFLTKLLWEQVIFYRFISDF